MYTLATRLLPMPTSPLPILTSPPCKPLFWSLGHHFLLGPIFNTYNGHGYNLPGVVPWQLLSRWYYSHCLIDHTTTCLMSTSHSGPVASTYFGPVANLLWSLSHYLLWSRGHYLLWTNGSSVLHESGQNSVGGLRLHSSKHFYICKIPGGKSRMQIFIRIWQNNTDPNGPRSGSTTLSSIFLHRVSWRERNFVSSFMSRRESLQIHANIRMSKKKNKNRPQFENRVLDA